MCSRQIFCYLTLKFYFHPKKTPFCRLTSTHRKLTSCVTLCVNKSSRHFTRIKCLRSIIVSKLECHILTKGRIHKNLNIFKTRSKCYFDFNLLFKFIRIARSCVIKKYMYMFCTMDCSFIVDIIICTSNILTDTAMLISELTRFDSFYIFFHRTPRVFRMLADRQRVPIALTQFCPC